MKYFAETFLACMRVGIIVLFGIFGVPFILLGLLVEMILPYENLGEALACFGILVLACGTYLAQHFKLEEERDPWQRYATPPFK